jgi:ribosomal protein L3
MAMLLGKKVGMTQVYDKMGELVPVTVIQAGPCAVMQVKTAETDGYHAVQLAYDEIKASRRKNPQIWHGKKLLFGIDSEMQKDLDENRIPDKLRQEFKEHETPLSGDIAVSVQQEGG